MALVHSKSNYVNFSSAKTQPDLCRMAFPYFLEDDTAPEKENIGGEAIKVTNRVFTKRKQGPNSH